MSRPLLLLMRPVEEAARSIAAAEAAGFAAISAPLLQIEPLLWDLPERRPDALLFTSARAPALSAARAPELRAVPAYAVGARTRDAAEAAGFRVAATGEGDASAMLRLAAGHGVSRLLHPAGEDSAPMDIPPGLCIERIAVYAARPIATLPDSVTRADLFATLLFSARSAAHFARLVDAAGRDRSALRLVALSPAVADAAGSGWRDIAIAAAPSLAEALAICRRLWQG